MQYYKNYNLTKYNSLGLTSIAKNAWFPEYMIELIDLIKETNIKFDILAGGTNVLLNEVIDNVIGLSQMKENIWGTRQSVMVSANYKTGKFINSLTKLGIGGSEKLTGLPGTIGGAVVMNSGSGDQTISDFLLNVTTIDMGGNLHNYNKEELYFGRRYSILQEKKECVLEAKFRLPCIEVNKAEVEKTIKYRQSFPKELNAGGIFVNWYNLKPYEKEIRNIKSKNVEISKYLNVLTHNGKANVYEILNFINKIRKIVPVPLKLEIKKVGF